LVEFHGFGSLLLKFSGDDDLAASGSLVDDSSDDGVGSHSDGHLTQQFELAGLCLSTGAQSFVLDFHNRQFDCVFRVVESFLHQ
jgi:hypothetical protein